MLPPPSLGGQALLDLCLSIIPSNAQRGPLVWEIKTQASCMQGKDLDLVLTFQSLPGLLIKIRSHPKYLLPRRTVTQVPMPSPACRGQGRVAGRTAMALG